MRVAPRWVRRPMSLLLVLGLALAATTLPLLVVVAAAASLVVPGRWRPLRVLAFMLVYLALEVIGLAVALALWVASGFGWKIHSERFEGAHYAVLGLLLSVVDVTARAIFQVRVETDDTGWSPLDDGVPGSERAMVVLSRHAGPGDSFLVVRTLLDRDHRRRPRIVLKETLQLDPLVDVYLNRLHAAWIPPDPGPEVITSLAELAGSMGDQDALLIFPEGGNFTPRRRLRAIARLRAGGLDRHAVRAEQMAHVLPPKPGGVQAALAAAPHADVVFVAHTGLEGFSTPGDLWRGMPMDETLHLRWDFVAAEDVPRDPELQVDWLYERWADIDTWIAAHRAVEPRQQDGPSRP